jgi:hypothetical protein
MSSLNSCFSQQILRWLREGKDFVGGQRIPFSRVSEWHGAETCSALAQGMWFPDHAANLGAAKATFRS